MQCVDDRRMFDARSTHSSLRPLRSLHSLTRRQRPLAAATIVAQQGDASIAHDAAAGTWTLAAGGATLTLALDASRDFADRQPDVRVRQRLDDRAAADTFVRVGDAHARRSAAAPAGFAYRERRVVARGGTLQLNATFRLRAGGLTRHAALRDRRRARRRSKPGPPIDGAATARRSPI